MMRPAVWINAPLFGIASWPELNVKTWLGALPRSGDNEMVQNNSFAEEF